MGRLMIMAAAVMLLVGLVASHAAADAPPPDGYLMVNLRIDRTGRVDGVLEKAYARQNGPYEEIIALPGRRWLFDYPKFSVRTEGEVEAHLDQGRVLVKGTGRGAVWVYVSDLASSGDDDAYAYGWILQMAQPTLPANTQMQVNIAWPRGARAGGQRNGINVTGKDTAFLPAKVTPSGWSVVTTLSPEQLAALQVSFRNPTVLPLWAGYTVLSVALVALILAVWRRSGRPHSGAHDVA